jgi:hypothetical protein
MRNWQAWTCTLITFTGSGTIRSSIKQLQCNAYYFTGPYLSGSDSPHFRIDEAKIAEDARSDGKWVLRTNTELDSAEVALQYFYSGRSLTFLCLAIQVLVWER